MSTVSKANESDSDAQDEGELSSEELENVAGGVKNEAPPPRAPAFNPLPPERKREIANNM